MADPPHAPCDGAGGDVLSTVGLVLHLAAIISMALWLSMAGGGTGSGATIIAGTLTIGLFAASILCFAADGPGREDAPTTRPQPVLPQ